MNQTTLRDALPCPARPVTPLGILSEKLKKLSQSLSVGSVIDSHWIGELHHVTELANGIDDYTVECTTPESVDLANLSRATASENWDNQFRDGQTELPLEQEMLSGHVEGQFLKILVAAIGASDVLEIGMFTGYSALAIAEGLGEHGRVVACELDPYAAEFARQEFDRSKHGNKIQIEVGPASTTLQRLAGEGRSFDFVFIDADKPGYKGYLCQLIESNLLCPGALICVDNTLLQGETYCDIDRSPNGQAVADFNRFVANDSRVEQVLIPLRDGITMIRLVNRGSESGE